MSIPKLPRRMIGNAYLFAFVFIVFGLLYEYAFFQIVGVVAILFTWWSDDDETNHVDPADTVYVNDRDEMYTAKGPVWEQLP